LSIRSHGLAAKPRSSDFKSPETSNSDRCPDATI
jgi:hypothetical protein